MRLVRAAVTAGAGAAVTLAQLNLPTKRFWDDQTLLLWACVLAIVAFVMYDAIRTVNYALQAKLIRKFDSDVRGVLSAMVAGVAESTTAQWDEISVRYYVQRTTWFRSRLLLIASVKAGADVLADIHPIAPGQGVVGTAFTNEVILGEDWSDFKRKATLDGKQEWMKLPGPRRYGLSWGQLRRSADVPGMVASPTFDTNGRARGCILIAGPIKKSDLVSESMRRVLDSAATVLDDLGPPPRGWWDSNGR